MPIPLIMDGNKCKYSLMLQYPYDLKLPMVIIIMTILKKKIIWIMARCRGDLDCDLNIFEIFEVFIPA